MGWRRGEGEGKGAGAKGQGPGGCGNVAAGLAWLGQRRTFFFSRESLRESTDNLSLTHYQLTDRAERDKAVQP